MTQGHLSISDLIPHLNPISPSIYEILILPELQPCFSNVVMIVLHLVVERINYKLEKKL